jgi:DNA modification methylase
MSEIILGDCREKLLGIPSGTIQTCVTSPPYFGLRDYGTATWEGGDPACDHVVGEIRTGLGMAALGERYRGGGHKAAKAKPMTAKGECPRCGARRRDGQIGLEETPQAYVEKIVAIFREVRRVLRKDGTVWLNLGDSYANGTGTCHNPGGGENSLGKKRKEAGTQPLDRGSRSALAASGLKPKDLIGIPWRVAFAPQEDGWYLRQDIIWHKPNPMPESVKDRCTKSHEHIFLLAKSRKYYFDSEAIKEPSADPARETRAEGKGAFRGQALIHPRGKNKKRPAGWDPGPGGHRSLIGRYRQLSAKDKAREMTGMKATAWLGAEPPLSAKDKMRIASGMMPSCHTAGWRERERRKYAETNRPLWAEGTKNAETPAQAAGRRMHENRTAARDAGGSHDNPFGDTRNRRDVWTICTRRFDGDHYATFPQALAETCILAGSPKGGIVLDPFFGAGTTGLAAAKLGREFIGIELNPKDVAASKLRIFGPLGNP